jgi:hypothetical protein
VIDKFDLPKAFLASLIRVAVANNNGGAEGIRKVRDLLCLPFLTGLGQVFKARTRGLYGWHASGRSFMLESLGIRTQVQP